MKMPHYYKIITKQLCVFVNFRQNPESLISWK